MGVQQARAVLDPLDSPPWDTVPARYRSGSGTPLAETLLEPLRFRHVSPYVPFHADFIRYAAPCFPRGRPLLDAAHELRALPRAWRTVGGGGGA